MSETTADTDEPEERRLRDLRGEGHEEPDPNPYVEYKLGHGRIRVQFHVVIEEMLPRDALPEEGDRLQIEGRWFEVHRSYPVTRKHKASAHSVYDVFDHQVVGLVQETGLSSRTDEANERLATEPPAGEVKVQAVWRERLGELPEIGEAIHMQVEGDDRLFVVARRNPWFLELIGEELRLFPPRGPGGRPGRRRGEPA